MMVVDYLSLLSGIVLLAGGLAWLVWVLYLGARQALSGRKDTGKVKENLYCPEHDQPWVWVGKNGQRICAHWLEVTIAEARHGCPQFKDE